jgi:FkbM family methyltransferase
MGGWRTKVCWNRSGAGERIATSTSTGTDRPAANPKAPVVTGSEKFKQFIGKSLINACDVVPGIRTRLCRWGLRTRQEWFGRRVVKIRGPSGHHFKLASVAENYLSFQLFWSGAQFYEPITAMVIKELVQPGGVFIDAGANIGFHSLFLAATHPLARAIAFEPSPKMFRLLTANVAVNGFTHIKCEPFAIGDANTSAQLFLSASDHSASLRPDFDPKIVGQVEVSTITLDHYLEQHTVDAPLVIKLDVEGNEVAALRGAQETIKARRPDIVVEAASDADPELATLLGPLGYRCYSITDQGLLAAAILRPIVRGPFVFLNSLLSARSPAEIGALFHRIEPRVQKLDLSRTSKQADPRVIERALTSQETTPAPSLRPC